MKSPRIALTLLSCLGLFSLELIANGQPSVTTLAASSVTATNARLNGTVNPNSVAASAYFQYGLTTNYGSFSATNSLAATNTTLSVSNLVSGLTPGTTYHFQLVAANSAGSASTVDGTFTTSSFSPAVATVAASSITATNARLNGSVNPNGAATTAYFQYGLTTNYGSFTATNSLAATNTAQSVSNLISGLVPGTTYHFRLVGINSAGTSLGGNLTFTTSVAAPRLIGGGVFSNSTVVTIPSSGAASPYPSIINISGQGPLTGVTATLRGLSHDWPGDVDILLVGPTGIKVMLMSDCGEGSGLSIANVNLTLDDDAANNLPATTQITSGVFRPTDYPPGETLPAPAPAGPYGTTLSAFNGSIPNGDWQLYVVDDTAGDAGSLDQGWSLDIESDGGPPAASPAPTSLSAARSIRTER